MLNLQHIRERLGRDFEPFTIRLSDGRRFEVPHPDFIAVGRGVVLIVDEKDNSYKIDALHIVSLDSPKANGQRDA
jgi:hypothetical protein